MPSKNQSLEQKIEKWISDQGYPLEIFSAEMFQKYGYQVNLSSFFMDFESKQQREIDITATRISDTKKSTVFQFCINAECKFAKDKPWIVFISKAQPAFMLPFNIFCTESLQLFLFDNYKRLFEETKKLELFNPSSFAHGLTQAFTSRNDVTFKALMSAMKSSVARVLNFNNQNRKIRTKKFELISIPLIIIDGKLFESIVDDNQKVNAKEIDFSCIYRHDHNPVCSSYVTYVVTKSYLEEFIKNIEKVCSYFMELTNKNSDTIENIKLPE